jgi:hypothetical protein
MLSNKTFTRSSPGKPNWRRYTWLSIRFRTVANGRCRAFATRAAKYYDKPERFLDKAAFTFTGDLGCESGGGVSCTGKGGKPKQAFLGYMFYNRLWFKKDLYGMTIGGGQLNNPGRYLVLLPPINGATASPGTPYYTENPGQPYHGYDTDRYLRLHA